jgi:hypothetical protein
LGRKSDTSSPPPPQSTLAQERSALPVSPGRKERSMAERMSLYASLFVLVVGIAVTLFLVLFFGAVLSALGN